MREQIQQLIAQGRTEEALALLAQNSGVALHLQARYNNGKKQYNMGLIEFSEWQRVQAQINYAALELSNSFKAAPKFETKISSENVPLVSDVFIAYNEKDKQVVDSIRKYLHKNNITGIFDYTQVDAGEFMKEFIINKFTKTDFVLALISPNSLREGWAGLERHLDIFSNAMITKNFIPLVLDYSFTAPDFIKIELSRLNERLDSIENEIQQQPFTKRDAGDLEVELIVLRNNLPKIVQRLRSLITVDIRGENLETGMKRVHNSILKANLISQSAT